MESLTLAPYRTISTHTIAEVRRSLHNNQNALFALRSWNAGDIIADFSASSISAEPTYLTIQVGTGKHITLAPEFLQYINHSCDPNVFFDTTSMNVIALKKIPEGEELCFFYPSSEWKMIQSFTCYCKSPHCLHEIRGASYLSRDAVEKYRFTDFIAGMLSRRASKRKVA
jgi:hypothetical protein